DQQKNAAEDRDRQPVPLADPVVELVFAKVGNVRQQLRCVVVQGAPGYDPAYVGPEAAVVRRVRVARLVGILMMDTVDRYPEVRPALQGQRGAGGQEVFNPLVSLVAAMREQAVIANADPQASRYPVQKHSQRQILPAEHKQRRNGANME